MPLWRQIQCYSRSQMPPVWPPSSQQRKRPRLSRKTLPVPQRAGGGSGRGRVSTPSCWTSKSFKIGGTRTWFGVSIQIPDRELLPYAPSPKGHVLHRRHGEVVEYQHIGARQFGQHRTNAAIGAG